jgi:hypothetical protein
MRRARLKADPQAQVAYYHCVSRVVGRAFLLGDVHQSVCPFIKEKPRPSAFISPTLPPCAAPV